MARRSGVRPYGETPCPPAISSPAMRAAAPSLERPPACPGVRDALFTEPGRKGGTAPWAGDFRPANDAGNGPKDAVGSTFTLELPDGRTGKVVVQSRKSGKGGVTLALMGEDAPPF
jgi:hypothetical protein